MNHSTSRIAYLFSAPAVALILLLFVAPLIAVVVISFAHWDVWRNDLHFVGLANYLEVCRDPAFQRALANTALYAAVVVPTTLVLALAIALAIRASQRLATFYRAAHFLPMTAAAAAMALSWQVMLHPTVGIVNAIARGLGFSGANWLRDPDLVLGALCVIGVWQHVGFAMVLLLAGLQTIPKDLYAAAEVDGAGRSFDRLWTVTLPAIRPVMMFVSIVVALRAIEVFDTVRILTAGGPGFASETLLHTLYVQSFEYFRVGYGASVAVILLLIVISLSVIQARLFERDRK